jgi:hypothetical protein
MRVNKFETPLVKAAKPILKIQNLKIIKCFYLVKL